MFVIRLVDQQLLFPICSGTTAVRCVRVGTMGLINFEFVHEERRVPLLLSWTYPATHPLRQNCNLNNLRLYSIR